MCVKACEAKGVHDMNHTRLKIVTATPAQSQTSTAAPSPFRQAQAPPSTFMLHTTSGRPGLF